MKKKNRENYNNNYENEVIERKVKTMKKGKGYYEEVTKKEEIEPDEYKND